MPRRISKLIVGFLVVSVALWGAADPIIGTWKLNPGKSKGTSANPVPMSLIYTWAAQEGGMFKLTRDEINDKGQSRHSEWSGKFDGKDYLDTGDHPAFDTMAVKRTGDRTFEFTTKKQGKVSATQKTVISEDGKTLTNVNSLSYTAVFDRQ